MTKNVSTSAWNKKVVRLDESIVFATEEEAIEYCNDKKLKIRRY